MCLLPPGRSGRAEGAVELVGERVGEGAGREDGPHQRLALGVEDEVAAAARALAQALAARLPAREPARRKSAKVTNSFALNFARSRSSLRIPLGQLAAIPPRTPTGSRRERPPGREQVFQRRLLGPERGLQRSRRRGRAPSPARRVGSTFATGLGRQQVAADLRASRSQTAASSSRICRLQLAQPLRSARRSPRARRWCGPPAASCGGRPAGRSSPSSRRRRACGRGSGRRPRWSPGTPWSACRSGCRPGRSRSGGGSMQSSWLTSPKR